MPGLAKTLTVKTTADVLGGTFNRIQFTPDLVPSDLIGTRIYRPDNASFDTELGPVFCNFLLADEINRAPAKVQSALLEVMQERQVTLGHTTHPVPDPFLVMATQNPIESEGTYPLPEAQVDRFMLKILVDYPPHDEELTVDPALARAAAGADAAAHDRGAPRAPGRRARDLRRSAASSATRSQLATATRRPAELGLPELARFISFGASPRGPIALIHAARGLAVVRGRDYVLVQDLQELIKDALRHRLVLSYEALAERRSADSLLDEIVAAVPVPQLDLARRTRRDRGAPPPRADARAPGPGPMPEPLLRALDLTIARRVEGLLPAITGRPCSGAAASSRRSAPTSRSRTTCARSTGT